MELPISALFSVCIFKRALQGEKNMHYSYSLLIVKGKNTGALWTAPREQKK